MIRPVTYYQAVCDRCGSRYVSYDYTAWSDENGALEMALESDWHMADNGRLTCDFCRYQPGEADYEEDDDD